MTRKTIIIILSGDGIVADELGVGRFERICPGRGCLRVLADFAGSEQLLAHGPEIALVLSHLDAQFPEILGGIRDQLGDYLIRDGAYLLRVHAEFALDPNAREPLIIHPDDVEHAGVADQRDRALRGIVEIE